MISSTMWAWTATLARDAIPVGPVDFGAMVVTPEGLHQELDPHRLHVLPPDADPGDEPGPGAPGQPFAMGWIDVPVEGGTEGGGVIEVTGWVVPSTAVDRVEVSLDGAAPQRARPYCFCRHDIAEHFDDPTAVLSGFWHVFDVDGYEPGRRCTIEVAAVGPCGRVVIGSREVQIGPLSPRPSDEDATWTAALAGRARLAASSSVPDEGLNLLVVTHHLGLGGAQLWLQEILRAVLCERDVAATVITPHDGPLRAELETLGAKVHVIDPDLHRRGRYESTMRELALLVGTESCNVVLANTTGMFAGVDLADRCGIPSVWAIHDHFSANTFWHAAVGRDQVDPHVRSRGRLALDRANAVTFVSQATKHLYERGEPDDRFIVIDYGIPLDEIDRARKHLDRAALRRGHGYHEDDELFVCVATVEARKAQSSLVLSLSRLADRHPRARIALVGAIDDAYSNAVARLAESLGLTDRVRLVPVTVEVDRWLCMADAFVLGSDIESLPRSIMEAMAHGVPVIATDAGGVREIVHDGDTGILCDTRDVGAMSTAMERFLELSPSQRSALGSRAELSVRRDRGVEPYTASYSGLLRGLAKDPGADPRILIATDTARS